MNPFDAPILEFFNQFSQQSFLFDKAMTTLSRMSLLKGVVMVSILWWFWFHPQFGAQKNRVLIFMTYLASLVSLLISKSISFLAPFRPRPLYNAELDFLAPHTVRMGALEKWSAFPSDHAVFFFSLVTGIFLINKRLGLWASAYAFVVICLPRIYIGYHYPTDILAGLLIGTASAYGVLSQKNLRRFVDEKILVWERKSPATFYALSFILTHQVATMFWQSRILIKFFFAGSG